jgi:hypothetical protein
MIRKCFKYRTEKLKAGNEKHGIIENAKESQIQISIEEGKRSRRGASK